MTGLFAGVTVVGRGVAIVGGRFSIRSKNHVRIKVETRLEIFLFGGIMYSKFRVTGPVGWKLG